MVLEIDLPIQMVTSTAMEHLRTALETYSSSNESHRELVSDPMVVDNQSATVIDYLMATAVHYNRIVRLLSDHLRPKEITAVLRALVLDSKSNILA